MKRVVSPDEMHKWDFEQIEKGIPATELMLRAAKGLQKAVIRLRKSNETVTILCGSGNNGGDGIALACLLQQQNVPVRLVLLGNLSRITAESKHYLTLAHSLNVPLLTKWEPLQNEMLVDALLGVGLDRPVTGVYANVIEQVNASGKTILSADIPSGLDANTGEALGIAVRASETVTMQFYKKGMLLGQGRAFCGAVTVCPLVTETPFEFETALFLQEPNDLVPLFPPRPFDSHKGKNGHALLCVGSGRYTGAALLSARAALRSGCGILSVCVPNPVRPFFSNLPEAITIPIGTDDWDETGCRAAISAMDGKAAIGIGCGMGSGEIRSLLYAAIRSRKPLVIDADGLNVLSANRDLISMLHSNVVLTPHPGEMARLLNTDIPSILNNPISAAQAFPCTVLLKGATTVVSDPKRTVLCTEGTPALAKGGSGDVLTGIITALLAQGLGPFDAARAGTYLLGTSAKNAYTLLGERMLLASDVIEAIRMEEHGK